MTTEPGTRPADGAASYANDGRIPIRPSYAAETVTDSPAVAAWRQARLKISVAAEWDSPAYEAIIRRAHASKADLIVAERHAGRHIHFSAARVALNPGQSFAPFGRSAPELPREQYLRCF